MSEKDSKSLENLNRSGRKKGSKNRTTLFKEAMREGFENKLMVYGEKVFDAVVEKALDGDMTAAKMILDRVVPVAPEKGAKVNLGEGGLVINIERLEANTATVDTVQPPIEISEAEFEEIDSDGN